MSACRSSPIVESDDDTSIRKRLRVSYQEQSNLLSKMMNTTRKVLVTRRSKYDGVCKKLLRRCSKFEDEKYWTTKTDDMISRLALSTVLGRSLSRMPMFNRLTLGTELLCDPNVPLAQMMNRLQIKFRGLSYRMTRKSLPDSREKLVVLGTGWASLYLLNQIDPTKYDVTIISPRPFFVYTPLLTAVLSGTLSIRTILEPIRSKLFFGGRIAMKYLQAEGEDIQPDSKTVICRDKNDNSKFNISYDKLVVAVGTESNTFNIPGVKEHSHYLKEVEDVKNIRHQIFSNFERASRPDVTDEEKKRLCSIVVVGGGPAGVEAAAELQDLLKKDLKKHFPTLTATAKVTVIEMLDGILKVFGDHVSSYTRTQFNGQGIETLTGHKVSKIDDKSVHVIDQFNEESKTIPYGSIIWASGVGQTSLATKIINKIDQQKGNRILQVHPNLRVVGNENIYALGDCAYIAPPSLATKSEEIYSRAKLDKAGATLLYLRNHFRPYFRQGFVQLHPSQCNYKKLNSLHKVLDHIEFKELLTKIDQTYKSPIPTAQMARQAGSFLGFSLNKDSSLPFQPTNYGHMSYIGGGKAVLELTRDRNTPEPRKLSLLGSFGSKYMWHGYYWLQQTSKYNRLRTIADFATQKFKGTDPVEPGMRHD